MDSDEWVDMVRARLAARTGYIGSDTKAGRAVLRALGFNALMDFVEQRRPLPPHSPVRLLREAMTATCGREVSRLTGQDWKIGAPPTTPEAEQRIAHACVEGSRVIWC